ncbi:MAG TPA: GAF domain-containing protein [Blastocatellia bacterium]|nr:GAF domain-containing protein [Blastocatellia bacterium]
MFDQIKRFIDNPVVLAITAAVAVLILGLIVFFLVRSSRRSRAKEAQMREKLMAMERERQFAAAIEQIHFRADASETAREVANLFREHLSVPVLAIYAGREGEDQLSNILPKDAPLAAGQTAALRASQLPETIPSSVLNEYRQPRITRLAPAQSQQGATTSPLNQPGAQAGSAPASDADTSASGASSQNTAQSQAGASAAAHGYGAEVMLIPWRGPFARQGIIVTGINQAITVESLSRYQDQLARLADRLAIALEFERERAELFALDERATRAADFSRALISCLDDPQPLASIAREVTKLVSADSAALWRVEQGSSMIRMVAAYGLKSAEFLPLPMGQGLAGSIVEKGEPIALEDAPSDPRCIFPREARESGIGSYLGVPISSNGETIGVVEAHTTERRTWTEGDERSLKSAAAIISEILKSTDTRGNRLRVESAYLGLSEALQRLRSPAEVMEAAVEVLGHALSVSRAVVVELDDEGKPQPVKYEYRAGAVSALGAVFKADAFAQIVASAEPVAINESRDGSLVDAEVASALQILSELAAPIRLDGKTRAVLYLNQCDRVREWQQEEIEFASRVASQLSLSLSNVRSLENALRDAEAAREEARRAAEATTRAQAMVNALPEMVIGVDREGRLTFFNPAARDRLGLAPEHLGRMVELTETLSTSHEALWDRVVQSMEVLRLETQLTQLPSSGEASGAQTQAALPVSVSVAPIFNNKGEMTGHLVVLNDISHVEKSSGEAQSRIDSLEQRLAELEKELSDARNAENQARSMLAKASAAEAKARAEADVLRRTEVEMRQEIERIREDQARAQASARQLLDINRLKSEFIVNAGREIEASLHSVLGFAELLEQGSYGQLTPEQHEAVRNLYGWGRRMKSDVDTLIEYGSTRSRRLEEGEQS